MKILIYSIFGNILHSFNTKGLPWHPAWSPDGSRLTYINQNDQKSCSLVIVKVDGSDKRSFATKQWPLHPIWSPDSRKIAFIEAEGNRFGSVRLFDVETNTFSEAFKGVKPYWGTVWIGGLLWSPDGRYMIYTGYDGKNHELFAIPINSKDYSVSGIPIKLTRLEGTGIPFWPALTNDGKQLSYGINEKNKDIYVMSIDSRTAIISGKAKVIANDRRWDGQPCWVPDGKGIIFVSRRDGQDDIYSINIENDDIKRLTFSKTIERNPKYTPDGKMISFSADGSIWGLSLEGGTVKKITPDSIIIREKYLWASNGTSIFATVEDSIHPEISILIQIDLNDSSFKRILKENTSAPDFSLSPNGNFLAISGILFANENGKYEKEKICVLNLMNGELKEISTEDGNRPSGKMSWTSDGKYILHDRLDSEKRRIFELLPVNGDPPIEVKFDRGNLQGDIFINQIDPFGDWVLITKDTEEIDIWSLGEN